METCSAALQQTHNYAEHNKTAHKAWRAPGVATCNSTASFKRSDNGMRLIIVIIFCLFYRDAPHSMSAASSGEHV